MSFTLLKHRLLGRVYSVVADQPLQIATPKISAVINTLNEQDNIAECIDSIRHHVNEIIVVDMESDDGTPEIAKNLGAVVYSHPRTGFVEPARNFAISKAAGDWILIIDADERFNSASLEGVRDLLKREIGFKCFRIARRNSIFGRWITGSGWGSDWQLRLFAKNAVSWTDEIHSVPIVRGLRADAPPSLLWFDHFNYETVSDFVTRMNRYTDHEVQKLQGRKLSASEMLRETIEEMVFRFDPKNDGDASLILAGLMASYRWIAWSKYWSSQANVELGSPLDLKSLKEMTVAAFDGVLKSHENRTGSLEDIEHFGSVKVSYFGFYEKENELRWMAKSGLVRIENAREALAFKLFGWADGSDSNLNTQISVRVNGRDQGSFSVPTDGTHILLSIEFNCPTAYVELTALKTWHPSDYGELDTRELSVKIGPLSRTKDYRG